MRYEIAFLERYHFVFYYVLSPGEADGPIGDPNKVLYALLLALLNYVAACTPNLILHRSYKSVFTLGCLSALVLLKTGISFRN